MSKKCGKKVLCFILVVVYNSDIQIGDLFMKRLIKGLFAMTTLLLSSCGNPSVVSKKVCNKYTILDDLQVECELYQGKWTGYIDKWLIDVKTSTIWWYEMSNGEHYLKVGVNK